MKALARIFILAALVNLGNLQTALAVDYKPFPALNKFVGHLEGSVFLCLLSEQPITIAMRLVSMSATEQNHAKLNSAIDNAENCSEEYRDQSQSLYRAAAKEAHKKPASVAKLKGVLSAWLSIMSAIPRSNLTEDSMRVEQEKDKRLFREKLADFEAEFFF